MKSTHPKWKKLTYEERQQIEKMLKQGKRVVEIADTLGVNRSTIYREVKREGMQKENYRADVAQKGECEI